MTGLEYRVKVEGWEVRGSGFSGRAVSDITLGYLDAVLGMLKYMQPYFKHLGCGVTPTSKLPMRIRAELAFTIAQAPFHKTRLIGSLGEVQAPCMLRISF